MDVGDWRLAAFIGLVFGAGLFCCLIRWITENYLPQRAAKQRAQRAAEEAGRPLPTASLGGVEYQIAGNRSEMTRVLKAGQPLMFRFATDRYGEMIQNLSQFMKARFGGDSPEQQAVITSPVVCPHCNTLFPDTWKAKVTIARAPPVCPGCERGEALLVFQVHRPGEVTAADVDALRLYWRGQATRWWQAQNGLETRCNYSMTCDAISQGGGYFCSGRIFCDACGERRMNSALDSLRDNPAYFGVDELRLARQFVAEQRGSVTS